MPSQTEFILAEAALQSELLRKKIAIPDTQDDLAEIADGYLAELFAEKKDMKAVTPIRSSFLVRLREAISMTEEVDTADLEKTAEELAGEKAAAEQSIEQHLRTIADAIQSYNIMQGTDFWPLATFDSNVFVSEWGTGQFYRFDYTIDGGNVNLGEPVLQTFVDLTQAAKSRSLTLTKQRDGKTRWITISSNTYKDAYKERFSKTSLEEAVASMQKSGQYGELRLEHHPSSRVGSADFSKVVGNFLLESGTFDDTERAQKAIATLESDTEGKFRTSIGFFYNPKYLVDGEYQSHVRIFERSVTQSPANLLTAVSIDELGGIMSDGDMKARLSALVGDEEAERIVGDKEFLALATALNKRFAVGFKSEEGEDSEDTDEVDVYDLEDAEEERAVWTTAYVNNLPDASFAIVLPGGTKDDAGKTTPRNLRKLPHHDTGGGIDLPHLRNALSREPQTQMSAAEHSTAAAHLAAHAKAEGIGQDSKEEKSMAEKALPTEIEIEMPDGSVLKAAREEVVADVEVTIKQSELKAMIAEAISGVREELLREIKSKEESELPRAVRYRVTEHGAAPKTKAEKEEAKEVVAAVSGSTSKDFWGQFPGGHSA